MLKLPSQTGLTNAIFARAAAETELLPYGVVNIFTESDSRASLLVKSPDVAAVSYTGSTHVGRIIAAEAAPAKEPLMKAELHQDNTPVGPGLTRAWASFFACPVQKGSLGPAQGRADGDILGTL